MATKVANGNGPEVQTPHTSGLFADMTLDGPEIGTLVIVFDRAKNLPNRKTMGKQNPYCAARLGKEAKKSETDRRGGQTPKWDQEIRFTVHDSPDYAKLKLSIFSEDKRTDLIGEAWVDLTDVVIPGGGKKDVWQGLNYKGKYAGELRIELTYYDERPKPAESVAGPELAHSLSNDSSRVKRRPLPSVGNSGTLTPDTIPQPGLPGRAKHGPRDLRAPPRANSMPPELTYSQSQPDFMATPPHPMQGQRYGSSPPGQLQLYRSPSGPQYDEYEQYQEPQGYEDDIYDIPQQPDFLPQLPPSSRSRGSLPPHLQNDSRTPPQMRPHSHIGLPHSHSSPMVPTAHRDMPSFGDDHQLQMELAEPSPYLEHQYHQSSMRPRRSDVAPDWQAEQPAFDRQPFAEEMNAAPPPPPVHSNSSPAVPQHVSNRGLASSPLHVSPHGPPPHMRHNSIPNSSPLQSFERKYSSPQRSPVQISPLRGDGFLPSPEQRAPGSSPIGHPASQQPSTYGRQHAIARLPNRHSIAEPYSMSTPPRPHPLSQEVPSSPSPYSLYDDLGSSPTPANLPPNRTEYRTREGLPMMQPRAVSPQRSLPPSQPSSAPRAKSTYDIQFPVRSFESSENSPLVSPQPHARTAPTSTRQTPIRKSISPHPTPPNSAGAMPFSPDSFNIHNPNSQAPAVSKGNSPHSPYQIRPGSEVVPRDDPNGPIVDWHGKEIDPSDRLPVDSWAPEPEKKTPTKSYGQGRDRDFGPRSANNSGGRNLSKDTILLTTRSRSQTQPMPMQPQPGPVPTTFPQAAPSFPQPSRNRLQKKSAQVKSATVEPLRERPNYNTMAVPNPYEQQGPDAGFYNQGSYGGSYAAMSEDALSREISNIDIGASRHQRSGSVPAPVAYVPVRSHRDRKTFY